jgi:hypothetical protein
MQHMLQHQHKHHVTTICQHTQRPALQGTSMHVKVIVKKKKPSKNIFFAKYRHIMLFLQKILFPKKSVTDLPLNRMHTVQNVYLATVPFSFATQWC